MITLIFSKNRACQLELLLGSLKYNKYEGIISVLYTYDDEFKSGYDKLIGMYPEVNFIKEIDFKEQVLNLLVDDYIMFLCDDDVMIRPFDQNCNEFEEFKSNKDVLCLSLRLAKDYDNALLKGIKMRIPIFTDNKWHWKKYNNDWGYPMSVTSHIFDSIDLSSILKGHKFDNPNDMERVLSRNYPRKNLMICREKASFINNLANQVQYKVPNKNLNISIKDLNNSFLKGNIIDLDDIVNKSNNYKSCFMLEEYRFLKK